MSHRQILVVLLGPHSSGKTTIGRAVEAESGIPFYPEIGTVLRKASRSTVIEEQWDFDSRVLAQESARDERIAKSGASIAIVETWHIGNWAFAQERDALPALERYDQVLNERLSVFRVAPVRVRISDEYFLRRCTEEGVSAVTALSFYRKVEKRTVGLLARLHSQVCEPLLLPVDAAADSTTELVRDWIGQLSKGPVR